MNNSESDEVMAKELYDAAVKGINEIITNTESDEYLLMKTSERNNVVHIAIRNKRFSFANEALAKFPRLLYEENSDKNNPLHVAAEVGNTDFVRQHCDQLVDMKPLRMQNSDGNTPLHVAIIYGHFVTAKDLVRKDPDLVGIINNSKEAPLHLVLKHNADAEESCITSIQAKPNMMIDRSHGWRMNYNAPQSQEEELKTLLTLLLEKNSNVACWTDASGLTPLHRAAWLNAAYNLKVIKLILSHCPTSAEVRDKFGKTILHHLVNRIPSREEGLRLLEENPGICGLINHRDNQGDTPLHLAVINKDFIMEPLLLQAKANQRIKNKAGLSVANLIEQNEILMMGRKIKMMTVEECDAAEHGDVFYFMKRLEAEYDSFVHSQDSEGRNFIHKLFLINNKRLIIPEEFVAFIKLIKKEYWHTRVMLQADRNGDTPFHILSRLQPENIKINVPVTKVPSVAAVPTMVYQTSRPQFITYKGYYDKAYHDHEYALKYLGETSFLQDLIGIFDDELSLNHDEPCLMQNEKGNTPLHEAIIAKNSHVITKLAKFSRNTTLVNNRKETICHLLASLTPCLTKLKKMLMEYKEYVPSFQVPSIEDEVMDDIIKFNTKDARHYLDVDGLSPLIRAVQAGNIKFAERLCSLCPELAKETNPKGQTFWHLLVDLPPESVDFERGSSTGNVVWSQLKIKDKDENTALHLAIKSLRFDLATAFLNHDISDTSDRVHMYNTSLLGMKNKLGETPGDMIGALPYLPPDFEKFIWKDSTMIGNRSMWGIPTTQMKEYVNTMGIIAGLITTMTFTAAFTVPGGLNQESGIPLLMNIPAFQVFIISDVLAFCSSMLVLICLLWIMATGNKSKSVVLLDFSIILLLSSFYTTLLTFMTGLYATTYDAKRWVAIVSVVPCCLLIPLKHKYLIINLVIPFGKGILIVFDKAYHFTSEGFHFTSEGFHFAWKYFQRAAWTPFQYTKELHKIFVSNIKLRGPRSSTACPQLPMSST